MFMGGVELMLGGINIIPTVGNLRAWSFLFPPEPIWVKLLKKVALMLCTTSGKAVKKINESPAKKPQFGGAGEGHAL
jgi:hypothetical protein